MGAITEENKGGVGVLGGTAIRPETREGWGGVADFLYNKKDGTFCGRTCKSWALITIFYIIYYTCLLSFCFALYNVFLLTISYEKPTYTAEDGIIGQGMAVVPAQHPDMVAISVLELDGSFDAAAVDKEKLDGKKDKGNKGYVARIKKFLEPYEAANPNATVCDGDLPYTNRTSYKDNEFCKFDTSVLGDCATYPYGYGGAAADLKPCVYIKVNRAFGLIPKPIKGSADFPKTGDASALEHIEGQGFPDKIFIQCQGEYPADREVLQGKMAVKPDTYDISLKYFPLTSKYNKQNAMIALQFSDLPVNRLIHVICKAYYKGVVHSKKYRTGLTTFQLLVKDKVTEEANSEL